MEKLTKGGMGRRWEREEETGREGKGRGVS